MLAACELIGSMVNHSKLSLAENYEDMVVRPKSMECRDLISILLVDLISPLGPPFRQNISMLQGLALICERPHFNNNGSVKSLNAAVGKLQEWIDHEATLESVWLPEIDKELSLSLRRKEFLYICGNIAKHNLFRLDKVAEKLLGVLQRSDTSITLSDAYKALESFQAWIMDDVFLYHLSYLSQMLNDIVWGIHDYLLPEYWRAYRVNEEESKVMHAVMYEYDVPTSVTSELGRIYYWNLMNLVRGGPYVKRFIASQFLIGKH